jgi:hypothetical protein
MSFKIVENLTPKEKTRRAQEYSTWLEENGYLPQSEDVRKALLHVHSLTQELIRDLQRLKHDTEAALKLATNIEEILNTIK